MPQRPSAPEDALYTGEAGSSLATEVEVATPFEEGFTLSEG